MSERVVAVLRGTDDLHMALRARAEAINISREDLDSLQNCARGYSGKQLSPKPQRRLSIDSMFTMANAMGCDLALVENSGMMKLIAERTTSRNPNLANHAAVIAVSFRVSKRFLRTIGRKGGKNSRKYMTKKKARLLARKAGKAGAKARWSGETKRPAYSKVKKPTPRESRGTGA